MNAIDDMSDLGKLIAGLAIIAALSVAGTALMLGFFGVLTPTQPYAVGTQEGASHATTKHDSIDQYLVRGRRQQESAISGGSTCMKDESGLTQQATNNTCVTARRDERLPIGRKK